MQEQKTAGRCAIFDCTRPLVLASASPRRIAFFQSLGIAVTTAPPPPQAEPAPLPEELPARYAVRAAMTKAQSIITALPLDEAHGDSLPLIIAADTIVVLGARILGKPRDAGDAFAMLNALNGRKHRVITGCALLSADGAEKRLFAVSSDVLMWKCPQELLRAYAQSGEPLDKAGAYAIQGAGAFLIKSLEGSWSNVVGLPLAELVQELMAMGAIRAQP